MPTTKHISTILENFRDDQDVMRSTRKQYYNIMCLFFTWAELNGHNWQQLKPHHVIKFKERLFDDNKTIRTIRLYLVTVKIFYKWAENNGHFSNISKGIKLPRESSEVFSRKPLNEYQAKKFLKEIDRTTVVGLRDYAMYLLMFVSGVRSDSVYAMDVGDIKNHDGVNVIWYRIKGSHGQKTNFKPLTEDCINAIEAYLFKRGRFEDHWPLFATHSRSIKGTRLSQRSMRSIFKKRLKDIGISNPRITLHSIRHTHGTMGVKVSAYATQLSLNHKNSKTTHIYSKHADEDIIIQNEVGKSISQKLV